MSDNYKVKIFIEEAFLDLLEEKNYNDITVTDIVKRANVSRTSYYRHYSSIDDIVESITDHMVDDFFTELIPMFDLNDEEKLRFFLTKQFNKIAARYKIFPTNGAKTHAIVFYRLHEKLSKIEPTIHDPNNLYEKYNIPIKMSIINGIGKKWLDDNMAESIEDIVEFTMSILRQV